MTKKLTWGDYQEGRIKFMLKEDEKRCIKHLKNNNELSVDEFGRVYNEGGEYIADVEFTKDEEELV